MEEKGGVGEDGKGREGEGRWKGQQQFANKKERWRRPRIRECEPVRLSGKGLVLVSKRTSVRFRLLWSVEIVL